MTNPRTQRETAAFSIVKALADAGYEALYAGGYVRDMILGNRENSDIDIATNATPATISSMFEQVIPVGEHFGVMIVVKNDTPFEVATFRSDVGIKDGRRPGAVVFTDAKTDALRRDFTINGLFYNPLSGQILDFVGGQDDLKARVIRAIGDPALRFSEDYLRLLRAIRFSARFGFAIDGLTWAAVKTQAQGITSISAERILQELGKMLTGPSPHKAMEMMLESGLLDRVLPEVSALKGVPQPEQFHPEGDVLVHTLLALSLLDKPSLCLAWSTLLHDIGKPSTMTMEDRIRFNNHQTAGAAMVRAIFRRLHAPNDLTDQVSACVDNHMNFMNVRKMRLSTLKQLLSRPTFRDELELHRADCLASHGDLDNVHFLTEKSHEFAAEALKPAPLLSGKDLIAMGFKPGPLFGEILGKVYEQQLEETLKTRDEAVGWVRGQRW